MALFGIGESSHLGKSATAKWFDYVLFTGIAIAAVIILFFLVHALVVRPMVTDYLEGYTTLEPAPLPAVDMEEAEVETLKERVDTFTERVEEGRAEESIVLSDRELNALIQDDNEGGEQDYRVSFQDGKVKADISFRLEPEYAVGYLSGLGGRYLSGTAWLDVSLQNGRLEMEIESFTLAGRKVPDWVLDAFGRDELQERLLADDDVRKFVANMDSIEVADGQIVFRPRPPALTEAE